MTGEGDFSSLSSFCVETENRTIVTMPNENAPGSLSASKLTDAQIFSLLRTCSLGDLFARAEQLQSDSDFVGSAALYKSWIASNASNPLLHAAYYNYGVALAKAGDPFGAINATGESIRLNPDFHPPYINLGRLFEDAGQAGAAVEQWIALVGRLAQVNGDTVKNKLAVFEQLGRVLEANNLDASAEDALKQSLEISSAQPQVLQHWVALRQRQCKWPVIEPWGGIGSRTLIAGVSPLSVANLVDDPVFHLAKAWKYNKDFVKEPNRGDEVFTHSPSRRRRKQKLRIGYVSSDLRQHAVGFAMTDVIEQHDRDRVEIHAYYCGIDRDDSIRRRIRDSVDSWCEINGSSDGDAARRIAADEIDILVDLNGYTKDARTAVFAYRPAPIAVNWFGFPGTMGSPYHHYIIADEHVVPRGSEIFYSEKVLRLACYQPNDRKRLVSSSLPTRAGEGLPEDAFVYCGLNGMQKTTPETFASWMRILARAPGSVLWLLGGTEDANDRLKAAAEQSGISPQRLVFAQKKPNPEHVARYALADLFLDTFPYGAHTTAADAIWMGVPVVTRSGSSFASRVCASLAQAAGIGDLVCRTEAIYEEMAVQLGVNRAAVAAIERKMLGGRDQSLLFDTPRLVRDLEGLYFQMWSDFQSGRLPVPNLHNLDTYHELGLDLHEQGLCLQTSVEDLKEIYRSRLEDRHKIRPLTPDGRLWNGGVDESMMPTRASFA